MADTSGLKHIKNIVRAAMALSGADDHEYTTYFNLAMRCARKFRLKYVREGEKTAKLTVDSTLGTIDYPDDMLDYIGLAIVVNGEYVYLTKRDGMNITTTTTGATEGYDSDLGEGEDVLDFYWDGFATKGGLNSDGYYYPDDENQRFVLRNITVTTIWLRYISSGIHLDNTAHYFPVRYEDAMIAYIVWFNSRFRKDISRAERLYLKQEFVDEISEVKCTEGWTLRELEDAINSTIHNGVRR